MRVRINEDTRRQFPAENDWHCVLMCIRQEALRFSVRVGHENVPRSTWGRTCSRCSAVSYNLGERRADGHDGPTTRCWSARTALPAVLISNQVEYAGAMATCPHSPYGTATPSRFGLYGRRSTIRERTRRHPAAVVRRVSTTSQSNNPRPQALLAKERMLIGGSAAAVRARRIDRRQEGRARGAALGGGAAASTTRSNAASSLAEDRIRSGISISIGPSLLTNYDSRPKRPAASPKRLAEKTALICRITFGSTPTETDRQRPYLPTRAQLHEIVCARRRSSSARRRDCRTKTASSQRRHNALETIDGGGWRC
jgi:hypothetical protein